MTNTAENIMFHTIVSIQNMDDASLTKAKSIFTAYLDTRVFANCSFEDDVWMGTDEYANVGLHFNFNEVSFRCNYATVLGITFSEFINYVKTFIAFTLGKNVLHSLQTFTNDVKRIIQLPMEDIYGSSADLRLATPNLCIDFFSMLPEAVEPEKIERLVNALEEYSAANYEAEFKKTRNLAQFDSYFLFHDILTDYWSHITSEEERFFFYPLYLWWQVTGVIPLRPREFILTKRNCLEQRDDGFYLSLRRNNLKGQAKNVSYKISGDYYEVTYKIPDYLAKEIQEYIEYTKDYDSTTIDTLFVSDTHYKHWGHSKHKNSRYLTYINMNTILKAFYHEIIEGQYHLNIVYGNEDSRIHEGEINYIHLGDTRHLALINLMAEGGTPITAMLLAGHDNPDMSAHYYSNIKNLIECRTYRQYRLVTKGNVSYQVSFERKVPMKDREFHELSNGAKCFSEHYATGDFTDCMLSAGPSGELGYCPTCKFYRKKEHDFFSMDASYQYAIDNDCKFLANTVNQVRKGMGHEEEIGEALLKLKNSSYSYQQYYKEKIAQLDERGKDIWEERNKSQRKN